MKLSYIAVLFIALWGCTPAVRFSSGLFPRNDIKAPAGNDNKEAGVYAGKSYTGFASYYGDKFQGNPTANGEIFNQDDFTAAHNTLPFGTKVKVTNLENNKSVIVRINDRGPFVTGRIIDLSKAAAEELDMLKSGVVQVEILVLVTPP